MGLQRYPFIQHVIVDKKTNYGWTCILLSFFVMKIIMIEREILISQFIPYPSFENYNNCYDQDKRIPDKVRGLVYF